MPKSVARREHHSATRVPQDDCELATQLVQALDAIILEQVERDLAVGSRPQPVAPGLELALNRLVAVEFPVDDNSRLLVFARDRLIAGREIDDTQARVTQPDPSIVGQPLAAAVWTAVMEGAGGARQRRRVNGFRSRKDRDNSAHVPSMLII